MSLLTSLLENLKAGQLHTFHGGIHPPQRKSPANLTAISDAGLAQEFVLQVRQHIGQAAQLNVKVGERVLKGQALTEPLNPMMVPVHAPTSGTISAIEDRPLCHPSGLSGLCIVLKTDGLDEWRPRFPLADYAAVEPQALITHIHQAGIAGLGGAAFPTNVKLTAGLLVDQVQAAAYEQTEHTQAVKKQIDTLIINGVECEPYISADDRLMREHPSEILQGIDILRHIVKPTLTILAVEDNKPEALAALIAAKNARETKGDNDDSLLIIAVPTKYPSGGQKQLIEVLTGQQVPHHGLSSDLGIVMQNVGTVFAIQQAIINDEPLIRRVVTLAGETFAQPGNAWVHIGTPIRYLLKRYGLSAERDQRIIIGGPMMGFTLHSAAAPIIKGCNCILAPKAAELAPPAEEMACIRCSKCADACPASLLPQQLYWYARSDEHEKLESHNLFDCIECGACAYVCPSNIPLVQYYRVAKADIRQVRHEAEQAERAKERFEARQARLALEKTERQERQAKAAAERKTRMAEQAAKTGADPVADALARVKARQLMEGKDGAPQTPEDMAAARAARKEEAKRNRALKAAQVSGASVDENALASSTEGKNPAVLAALARAKARKAAEVAEAAATDTELNTDSATATPAKNPAVAAAIAKAKAAQAAANKRDSGNEKVDHKKEAIKAAVARAKARQEAELQAAMAALNPSTRDAAITSAAQPTDTAPHTQATNTHTGANSTGANNTGANNTDANNTGADDQTAIASPVAPESTAPVDAKKAAIQAAVARAKARKAALADKPASQASVEVIDEPTASPEPELDAAATKQAAIQAAVARAKARKAALADKPASQSSVEVIDEPTASPEPELDAAAAKQAAIQAALARAKARKAANVASTPSNKEDES
ncbi:electron transport complex subunit RsxC [Oceanisphaera sp. W20_SRM_FM3]|uniref:electron transport complex subunit RsxC n=1 Tax=Oceanisphaera sp. W20_SRM_FM3 TaxID=3240267 RepID=UPI003F97BF5A